MSYVELAKELRESAANKRLMIYAADAIEQLDKDLERAKEWASFWEEEANEALKKFQVAVASKPRWIPVTESRPEVEDDVLVAVTVILPDRVEHIVSMDYINTDGVWNNASVDWRYVVTHWQKMPRHPEDK